PGRTVRRAVVHNENVRLGELEMQLLGTRRQVPLLVPGRHEDERVALIGHARSVARPSSSSGAAGGVQVVLDERLGELVLPSTKLSAARLPPRPGDAAQAQGLPFRDQQLNRLLQTVDAAHGLPPLVSVAFQPLKTPHGAVYSRE